MMRNIFLMAGVFALASAPVAAQDSPTSGLPSLQYTASPVAKPKLKAKTPKNATEDLKFAAPRAGEVVVSDRDFNRFVFSAPVVQLIFAAGAPVLGEPVYMAGNTQVLIQLQRGTDKSVQMVAELEGGKVQTLTLVPRPIAGVVHSEAGIRERAGAPAQPLMAKSAGDTAPRGEDIELLKRVVQGDIPGGFESISLPRPTRFDKFTVVPLAGWSDSVSRRVLVFSLVAVPGQTAVVAPPQFYRPGISAVLVDGDAVDANNSPTLYVVEEMQDE
jgi:hypothetical protein